MADEDEEVIIRDCPLHKYLSSNEITVANENIEIELVKCEPKPVKDYNFRRESVEFHNKIILTDHRAILAYLVLGSGFMFPEQISELDSIIDLENIQVRGLLSVKEKVLFSTVFCAVIASVIFSKQNYTLLKVLISALVGLSITKLLEVKIKYSDTNTMKTFINSLDKSSQILRQTFTYISESEFLLRSKLLKQNIILSEIDTKELKSVDYQLFLPELRKHYYASLKELCQNFIKTFNFITKSVTLIPAANLRYFSDISPEDLGNILLVPSLDELKKAFNIFLLLQSDFLKRLFLSYVTELWDKNNNSSLKGVMKCLKEFTKKNQAIILNLELMIKEYRRLNESCKVNNISSSNSPFILRNDDSFISFSRKLLIKSDFNIYSAMNEIRLLEEKLEKYELVKNSGKMQSNFNQFKNDILDDMLAIKDNLDSFMTTYKDNLNYLINSTRPALERCVEEIDLEDNKVEKKTGIAVGRSCFIPSNKDEVLISLSGPSASESPFDIDIDDFEPVPEPLPKSVLSELKGAIEEKRKEWIERERKILGASQVDLELDGLRPQQNLVTDSRITKSKSRTKCGDDIELRNELNLCNDLTINPCESRSNDSIGNETRPCVARMPLPPSFINNIKLAQGKFNLNTTEEIFD